MRNHAVALAVACLLSVGLSGCSVKVETNGARVVSAADLQKDLTDRLTKAGNAPQSVTCNSDLAGEVGKTATCEVVLGENNAVQANVVVDKVDGTKVDFTYSPALTQQQLQNAVKGLADADSVTCDAGLDGKVGATAKCQILQGDVPTDTTVTATKVEGLSIDFSIAS